MNTCECGCGEAIPWISTKGTPQRFVHNHHGRKKIRWLAENRGFGTPCWIWQLGVSIHGYGKVKRNGRTLPAHRVMYERERGAVPLDKQIDHLCRVKRCVNPDHLEVVTPAENVQRGSGSPLTPAMVREIRAAGLSYSQLAALYGVGASTIGHIKQRHTWRNVSDEVPA